jgi:hypothetical protein
VVVAEVRFTDRFERDLEEIGASLPWTSLGLLPNSSKQSVVIVHYWPLRR